MKRMQRKNFILEQKRKIGFYKKSKHVINKKECWEDGEELVTLRQELEKLTQRKHKIEK